MILAEEGVMHTGRAFIAGLVGAVVMSVMMLGLRAAGIPLHIEQQLAAVLGTRVWALGFAAHLLIGGAVGVVYGMVFEKILHQAGVGPGLLLGAQNTILAGFVWAILGGPGRFWSEVGPQGVIALFLVHMGFGAVVGSLYRVDEPVVYG
jgi:hypothetical protein